MASENFSVGIVGAGISGLVLAEDLASRGVALTLYDSSEQVGGVINSVRVGDYLVDCGPNTLIETSDKISELISSLGLDNLKIDASASAKQRCLVRGGKIIPVPSSPIQFFTSPLFSLRAKLALLREPLISRRSEEAEDESVAQFVRRRLNDEFLQYPIDALVGGIYAGDPEKLSVRHAFPALRAVEMKFGSLIKGQILGARERARRQIRSKENSPKISFSGGLSVLTNALGAKRRENLFLGYGLVGLDRIQKRWRLTFVKNGNRFVVEHDAVVLTIPAYKLSDIQSNSQLSAQFSSLSELQYPPVITVALGYSNSATQYPVAGFGMLVPRVENLTILGTIFSSALFPGRAPDGHMLLTSYVGGSRNPEAINFTDERLIELVHRDLVKLLKMSEPPKFVHVSRYPRAIPQYEIGYGKYSKVIEDIEQSSAGLFLAGNYRGGISLSDSINNAFNMSERVFKYKG